MKIDDKRELEAPSADENRELKVSSNLQLTAGNNEVSLKETGFHHGVAEPMTLEDYEKEIAREKELLNKAKKKIAMESSTPKDGISTWILLSGSNNPTTRPEMKPAFRIDPNEKKPMRNMTMTTKKRNPTTAKPMTVKPTKAAPKFTNNKLITRVKVSSGELKNETEIDVTTKSTVTTKKPQLTTKAKKYTTLRPKPTTASTTTTTTTTTTEKVEIVDDEENHSVASKVETSTFLIMEPKDADFDLPSDREPLKPVPTKKTKSSTSTKTKKKKNGSNSTNSTRIKKKSDKKTSDTKLSTKKPEKPITTQIYNYLAREVMPSVGVGLVGLVVTAGLATYFLGGPLTALRRSYDISNRRDDMAYDRSDNFGNSQDEGEMFGKVIAGMPENSAYRNNIRVSSYRPKVQQYPGYSQYAQQSPKYGAQQQLRYRTVDPYQNSYKNPPNPYPQYYQQAQAQAQAKSAVVDYVNQPQALPAQTQQQGQQSAAKFNIDSVDMTTNQPEVQYNIDYDDIAQSYFPQQDQVQPSQVSVEHQKMQEVDSKLPTESQRSEKITIVQAQSVPSNHRVQITEKNSALPTPAALTMSHSDEEYQNSIANAIMSQQKQFVVGSVIAENFEENPPSIVPEHGPRRRRNAIKGAVAKSLENNEIDEDENIDKAKVETTSTKEKTEETSPKDEQTTTHHDQSEVETFEETTTQYPVYNIENGQNNIFHLFRRIIDLKLRLGLNFLQNATLAFQAYLKGVEERVNTSSLFNMYMQNNTVPSEGSSRKSNKIQRKKVESL